MESPQGSSGTKAPQSGLPDPVPATLELARWLEPRDEDPWTIPVRSPYAVREASVVGFSGEPAAAFSPRDVPWLPSEFAHLALDHSESALLGFVNSYGLPRASTGNEQATADASIETILSDAAELRRAFGAWQRIADFQYGGSMTFYWWKTDTPEPDWFSPEVRVLFDFVGRVKLPERWSWTAETVGGSSGPDPAVVSLFNPPREAGPALLMQGVYDEPLSLLDVMRLLLFADITAGRRVQTCPLETCGKLFVWPVGSTRSRVKGAGRPPRYCSREHSLQASHQRRKAKERRKED